MTINKTDSDTDEVTQEINPPIRSDTHSLKKQVYIPPIPSLIARCFDFAVLFLFLYLSVYPLMHTSLRLIFIALSCGSVWRILRKFKIKLDVEYSGLSQYAISYKKQLWLIPISLILLIAASCYITIKEHADGTWADFSTIAGTYNVDELSSTFELRQMDKLVRSSNVNNIGDNQTEAKNTLNAIRDKADERYERYRTRWIPLQYIFFDRCETQQHIEFNKLISEYLQYFDDFSNGSSLDAQINTWSQYTGKPRNFFQTHWTDDRKCWVDGLIFGLKVDTFIQKTNDSIVKLFVHGPVKFHTYADGSGPADADSVSPAPADPVSAPAN
jgi:hypothetical protein